MVNIERELYELAYKGDLNKIKQIYAKNKVGRTNAVINAGAANNLDVLTFFIEETKCYVGHSLFYCTARSGSYDCLKYLIDNQEITWPNMDISHKKLIINDSIIGNNVKCVKYCLSKGYPFDTMSLVFAGGTQNKALIEFVFNNNAPFVDNALLAAKINGSTVFLNFCKEKNIVPVKGSFPNYII